MTGFGAASCQAEGTHYAVEVRSLNNRYFKSMVRLPEILQGLEPELESALAKQLRRGSVVLTVRFSDTSENAAATINTTALKHYVDQMLAIEGLSRDMVHVDLGAILALPGVVMNGTGEELLDRARPHLMKLVKQACGGVLDMRNREGQVLHAELKKHCDRIASKLAVIDERSPAMIQAYEQRLRQRMTRLLAEVDGSVKEEDIIREVAIFSEKSDIAEEVSRLQGHLDQFAEIIDADGDDRAGRTLDFISQEMLREANTIGSKCMDTDISRLIVEIKGDIDRIKEQAQNVE